MSDPIHESNEVIARYLREANAPTLLMSLVHLTGSTDVLRPAFQPTTATFGDDQGGLDEATRADIARVAGDALRAYRDRGGSLPPAPTDETLLEMMKFITGGADVDEYVPLLLEEMGLGDQRARGLRFTGDTPPEARAAFRVAIVGAGMSGLLAAIRLKEAGIPFVIFEKNADVGGTWLENQYPGCRVDVPNHYYSYSFESGHEWPQYFSTQDELLAYFQGCSEKYGLREHIRFETEVRSAEWDGDASRWNVTVAGPGGATETLRVSALISAVGQLNRPKFPDIPGRDRFRGEAFHSAQWRHDLDLRGKRVAVIGTGASAFQFVPEIVDDAEHITIFQRSAPWMFPTDNYHDHVGEGERWLMRHVPFYAAWYRFWLFWTLSDGLLPVLTVDPKWQHLDRSACAANDELRDMLIDYLKTQIEDDPELLKNSIPSYPLGGKRMLRDNGSWLRALQRDNVELVASPVVEITEDGPATKDGAYPADVLIYGTGFKANDFMWPMKVVGESGVPLNEQWQDDPRAYIGITVPDFPNLFCLYGPNTNLVHGGSIIFHSECQVRYVMGCIGLLLEREHHSLTPKREVYEAFNRDVDEANAQRTWGMPGIQSWYRNSKGRVTQNWPWRLVDFWSRTRAPNPDDFDFA